MNVNVVPVQLLGKPWNYTKRLQRGTGVALVYGTARRYATTAIRVAEIQPTVIADRISRHIPPAKLGAPFLYVGRLDPLMPIPRCDHGVYSPDGDGSPSEYCTGCYSSDLGICDGDGLLMSLDDERDDPYPSICPECSGELIVRDDYDFECLDCGFDDL